MNDRWLGGFAVHAPAQASGLEADRSVSASLSEKGKASTGGILFTYPDAVRRRETPVRECLRQHLAAQWSNVAKPRASDKTTGIYAGVSPSSIWASRRDLRLAPLPSGEHADVVDHNPSMVRRSRVVSGRLYGTAISRAACPGCPAG